jgi:voltage-gated potassium channel
MTAMSAPRGRFCPAWFNEEVDGKLRSEETYRRVEQAVERPLLVLSVAFVPVLLAPVVFDLGAQVAQGLEVAAWLIWGAFALEYVTLLWLAPDRWAMVRTHKLDLVIVVLPFLRPLRALRALRLLQAGSGLARAGVGVNRLFGRRGFSKFLVVAGGVIAGCGAVAWAFEGRADGGEIETVVDGLWWALVTATTVGYGDMVPVTPQGRAVAVLLLLVGVALLSVVTANIAAFFVEESDDGNRDIQARLDRIEALLADRDPGAPNT